MVVLVLRGIFEGENRLNVENDDTVSFLFRISNRLAYIAVPRWGSVPCR